MNDFLKSIIFEKSGKDTIEFKEITDDLSIDQINFYGVRDVRLINKNVLTPKDVNKLKESVINLKFGPE